MFNKKFTVLILFFCVLVWLTPQGFAQKTNVKVDGQVIKDYITYMADDKYMGRKPNTPQFQELLQWAADKYKEWDLEPAGDDGSYFQTVPLEGSRGSFAFSVGTPKLVIGGREFFARFGDYTIDDKSTPGKTVRGDVVFVGYGISAPDKGLDEYAGVNVNGKIVFVYKGSPNDAGTVRTSFSPAAGEEPEEEEWGTFAQDSTKIKTAYAKGAAGIMFYDTRQATASRFRMRRGPSVDYSFTRDFIIVSSVNDRVYKWLFFRDPQESQRGFDRRMVGMQQDIKKKKPCSFATKVNAEIKGYDSSNFYSEALENNKCKNVIGKITGSDRKLKNEYIVLGGHYDHLGVRNGQIYNGADDNASGSAVVMEVARLMKKHKIKPKRTVIFALWTGEEMGLIGSRYWTKNPTLGISMDKVVTNFNMDMVALGDQIGAPGALNFPKIWEVMQKHQDQDILDAIQASEGGPGGSDHSGFIELGIQSLALMTRGGGGHPDYHDFGDDADICEPEILRKTGQFVLQATINVGNEKGSMVIPDRQHKYDGMRWNITPISADVNGGWRNLRMEAKEEMAEEINEKIAEMKRPQTTPTSMMRMMRRGGGMRAGYNPGIASGEVVGYDTEFLSIAKNVLNFGRIDIKGDDGVWFSNGLTEKGKAAIKAIQDKDIVLNLINPTPQTFNDVLASAEKAFLVCGMTKFTSEQIDLMNEKKVLVAVDFNPADVKSCLNTLLDMKKKFGDGDNMVLNLTSRDELSTAKKELYMRLVSKGWEKNDIYAISGTGAARGSRGNFNAFGGGGQQGRRPF